MITGSALTRLLNCPSSAALPKAETHNEWADAGTDEHEELAHQTMTGAHPAKRAALIPPNPRVEVKLAYDVAARTARLIGAGTADRNYGIPGPFEIFMSTDVLGVDDEDRVIVIDWKTGHADVEPARTNGQVWGAALAGCRALGKDTAIVRLVYTNMGDRCDEYEIDALELAEFAGKLERLHVQVAAKQAAYKRGEVLDTREGSWCKHCASKAVCPSKNALLIQVSGMTQVIGDATMTPERATGAYEQVVRIEGLVRDARKRLEMYVDDNGPIDLGGGRMFGRYVRNGNERLDGAVAVRAIHDIVSPEIASEFEAIAVERRTSKAAIERAAKQFAAKRGTVPAITKRIRELGGSTHGADTMPIGEYVADRNESAEKPVIDVEALNRALESA